MVQKWRGSLASSRWMSVVPERIIPTTTSGASITSSAIFGWLVSQCRARNRLTRLRTAESCRIFAPTRWTGACA